MTRISRRRFGATALQLLGVSLLAGCDALSNRPSVAGLLDPAEGPTRTVQRLFTSHRAPPPGFTEEDRSPALPAHRSTQTPGAPEHTRARKRLGPDQPHDGRGAG